MTLEERVRYLIGEGGPQHESKADYEQYVTDQINRMDQCDMLHWISMVLEEAGVTFPEKGS